MTRGTGTVSWFSARRGVGFVVSDDDRDLFVRTTPCPPSHPCVLAGGTRVGFVEVSTTDGPEASEVVPLDPTAGLAAAG